MYGDTDASGVVFALRTWAGGEGVGWWRVNEGAAREGGGAAGCCEVRD